MAHMAAVGLRIGPQGGGLMDQHCHGTRHSTVARHWLCVRGMATVTVTGMLMGIVMHGLKARVRVRTGYTMSP